MKISYLLLILSLVSTGAIAQTPPRSDAPQAFPSALDIAGGGTVTSVSVTSVNGVSGTVANPTSTPAISLSLGAIKPTTIGIGTGAILTAPRLLSILSTSSTTTPLSNPLLRIASTGAGADASIELTDSTGYTSYISTSGATTSNVMNFSLNGTTSLTLGTASATILGPLTISTINTGTGVFMCESSGLILSGATTCVASDNRLKNDLGVVTEAQAVARVLARPAAHMYTYKTGYGPAGKHYGWFAQDIEKVQPELVTLSGTTNLTPDGTKVFDKVEFEADTSTALQYLLKEVAQIKSCSLMIYGHCLLGVGK